MNIKEMMAKLNKRMNTLKEELDSNDITSERIDEIESEVKEIKKERAALQEKQREAARQAFQSGESVNTPDNGEERTEKQKVEERVRQLKQGRSITIDSLDLLSIDHQSNTINPTFNQVSDLVGLIGIRSLPGGESFTKAYLKGYDIAGYTGEGQDAHNTEPDWGYAEINKSKITAYTEVSEEFEKLSPSMYLTEVQRNLRIALQRKLAQETLKGDGASNHLTGIFSAANAKAIEVSKDIAITEIDENTLDDIIYAYGGEEDFSPGVLVLHKSDLREFSRVRGAQDKRKVYDIDKVNQTIDGIPYVLNSAITPLANASVGDYVMAYGTLNSYELVAFSPVEYSKSTDYKFKQGQIAYKASGFFGGNVVRWNGFLRVKKGSTPE